MPRAVTQEELIKTLDAVIDRSKASIAKFKERLDESPTYAFEWGTDALAASATLRVAEEARHYANLDNEVDGEKVAWEDRLENMRQYFSNSLNNLATQVPASTSVLSNLVENYKRAATAKLVNTLNGEYFSGF